jgi:hypothetical protein
MDDNIKSKSILIDSDKHLKVKNLAIQYKVSVKKLIEDMINYCSKTGFNPSVMVRDKIMEKLNVIQGLLSGEKHASKDETSEMIYNNSKKLNEIQKGMDEFFKQMNHTFQGRIQELESIKKGYFDFIVKLYNSQHKLFNILNSELPNLKQGRNERLTNDLIDALTEFKASTLEVIEIKKRLFPGNKR